MQSGSSMPRRKKVEQCQNSQQLRPPAACCTAGSAAYPTARMAWCLSYAPKERQERGFLFTAPKGHQAPKKGHPQRCSRCREAPPKRRSGAGFGLRGFRAPGRAAGQGRPRNVAVPGLLALRGGAAPRNPPRAFFFGRKPPPHSQVQALHSDQSRQT